MASRATERKIVRDAAKKYGISASLLWGVYGQETRFGALKNNSSAGAQGPFQFMPGTARAMGVNPRSFKSSAYGAAKYLSQYKSRGTAGMLAAYNAGPAGNPNNPETRAYIPGVRRYAKTYVRPGGKSGGGGRRGGAGGRGTPVRGTVGTPATIQRALTEPGGTGLADLLGVIGEKPQPNQSAPLAPPAFSAQPVMPTGYTDVQAGPPPVSSTSLAAKLALASKLRGALPEPANVVGGAPGAGTGGSSRARGGGGGSGKINAGRGWGGSQGVASAAIQTARRMGAPITSRKRSTRNTASGNVSDHYVGSKNAYAVDIAARGANGDRIARAVARQYGMQNRPGTYNNKIIKAGGKRYRVQLLWKVAGHFDHVHVGVKRV